jgi:hypothetical protein
MIQNDVVPLRKPKRVYPFDEKKMDPQELIDYNPISSGFSVGVLGLFGLPNDDASLYKVRVVVGTSNFEIDPEPNT